MAYIGIDDKARDISKIYVGVEQPASYSLVYMGTEEFSDCNVVWFDSYTLNDDGSISVTNPTTTTLETVWADGDGTDRYFYKDGESIVKTIYQIFNGYENYIDDRVEYIYEAYKYTVGVSNYKAVARHIIKTYIGVKTFVETVVDSDDITLDRFFDGVYAPAGEKPTWNAEQECYEFSSGVHTVDTQDFDTMAQAGALEENVAANSVYFIPDDYRGYYAEASYQNYNLSQQADRIEVTHGEYTGIAHLCYEST